MGESSCQFRVWQCWHQLPHSYWSWGMACSWWNCYWSPTLNLCMKKGWYQWPFCWNATTVLQQTWAALHQECHNWTTGTTKSPPHKSAFNLKSRLFMDEQLLHTGTSIISTMKWIQSIWCPPRTLRHQSHWNLPNFQPGPKSNNSNLLCSCLCSAINWKRPTVCVSCDVDQPRSIKSAEIVEASPNLNNITVHRGAFHLVKSYMGTIGHVVSGSGMLNQWETVYAPNSVNKWKPGMLTLVVLEPTCCL